LGVKHDRYEVWQILVSSDASRHHTSVESAKAIQRIAGIVSGCVEQQPVVVVTAMGKTTDSLLKIARLDAASNWQAAGRELARLRHST
jgi:aspartate kinase